MKTILAAVAASGVLVAGAFVTTAVTDSPASAETTDIAVGDDTEHDGPLVEVMDGLVADGILTQDEADEVESRLRSAVEEWRTERQERREERGALREERRADRRLIRQFLEDDVIDSDELSQLGEDHPFNDPDGRFAAAAADGEITRDELREIRESMRSLIEDASTEN